MQRVGKFKYLLLLFSLFITTKTVEAYPFIHQEIVDLDVDSQRRKRISLTPYKNLNADVIDIELMEANGLEPLDFRQYHSGEEVIQKVLADFEASPNDINLAFYDYRTGEEFYLNPDNQMIVASVSKVPMVALYIDRIEEGKCQWSDKIPYNPAYYRDGAGRVTNSPKKESYSIEELAHEAIVNSDNTASYLLTHNYIDNYGDIRQAILDFAPDYRVDESTYFSDNYGTAYTTLQIWKKIAEDSKYSKLIDLMQEDKTDQLFISYLKSGIANKYGRLEKIVNDAGIFYSPDGEAQFVLVVFTDNLAQADPLIEELGLRMYEWHSQTNNY